jgi:hypothetical protein
MSSASAAARCDRPRDATTIASTSVVFPAAFAPQMSWGPASNEARSEA